MLAEEFDRLTNIRTMVKKSSFVQRVKLKGDSGNSSSGFFFVYIVDNSLGGRNIL